jgi:hypothetical protein
VHVIGRHTATGALVRAQAHKATAPDAHVAWSALPLIVLASREPPTEETIMNVIPQAYPLECWTDGDVRCAVIGWTEEHNEHGGGKLVPIVLPLDGRGNPFTLAGPITYALPDTRKT